MRYLIVRMVLASAVSLAASTSVDAQRGRTDAKTHPDAFSRVHCGTDIVKALVGASLPSGRVAALEAAHADIKLEDVGGSSINDTLFLAGWHMCGQEYQLLARRDRIEDVLRFPPHSRRQPGFLGACMLGDRRIDDVVAVLDNPAPRTKGQPRYAPDDTTSLAAIAAWSVDAKSGRLVVLPASGVRCPRGGVFTADGGT